MKTFLFYLIALIPVISLSQPRESNKLQEEIWKTDTAFNDTCQATGLPNAFIRFAADEVILMRQDRLPILGLDSLRAKYSRIKTYSKLQWYPVKIDVAASGDLGYSFGNWELIDKTDGGKDTTMYGVYITIWKRQKDGSWKYVFDGGNSIPPPNSAIKR